MRPFEVRQVHDFGYGLFLQPQIQDARFQVRISSATNLMPEVHAIGYELARFQVRKCTLSGTSLHASRYENRHNLLMNKPFTSL